MEQTEDLKDIWEGETWQGWALGEEPQQWSELKEMGLADEQTFGWTLA